MPPLQSKLFPWKCAHCGKRAVVPDTISYSVDAEHDGRRYAINLADLEAPRCAECGEIVMDDAANARITAALRQAVGLLTPEQIRGNRETLGLTQKEFSKLLGIAEATVSRWETSGQIQQRSLDRLMRLFFSLPEVRLALDDEASLHDLGTSVLQAATGSDIETKLEMQAVKAALKKVLSSCQDAIRLAEAG